jgi:GDP-4-dehydro-6-deoxy-D-mannose reductase
VASSWRDPLQAYRINYRGSLTLLDALLAEAPRARVLLIGSSDAYGPAGADGRPLRESDPLAPASPYARSKAAAELLGGLAAARGLGVVRVRAFTHIGAGQSDQFVASSFARQVAEIAAGLRPPRIAVGNLESVRDLLDVGDVVDAYIRLLDPSVPPGIYNVASGRGVRVREVLDTLLELAAVQAEVEVDPTRYREADHRVGDATKLRRATGWEPRTPLRETLAAVLDSWREQCRPPPP